MNIQLLSKDEAIHRIEQIGGKYDPDLEMGLYDQLLACESIVESTPVNPEDWDGRIILNLKKGNKWNGSVNGSVNDIGKRQENTEETHIKLQAITELTTCTYRTSPKKIASLLQVIFSSSITQDGHWLWIGQHYTPKSINSAIHQMMKAHEDGWVTLKNPAAYFTDVLKLYHHMRKKFHTI